MKIKKIFTLLLMIISFSLLASAQDDYYEQEQRRMEEEKRQEEANKSFEKLARNDFLDLEFFLPKTENSWFISITAHGGIMGGTRLLAAVNSDGNYLCRTANQDFQNQLAAKGVFDNLKQNVAGFDFSKYFSGDVKPIKGCRDCVEEYLNFYDGKKIYSYNVRSFSLANFQIKKIYNQIFESATCN